MKDIRGSRFSKEIVLRIYRKMKNNPERIFILTDFGSNSHFRPILDLLVRLQLIEQVKTLYYKGAYQSYPSGTTIGYKFLR